MDLAEMICDLAKTYEQRDAYQNSFILQITYYDGIETSLSKACYIYQSTFDTNIVICKYKSVEYKTRCFDELKFLIDLLLPSIITESSIALRDAAASMNTYNTDDEDHPILSSTHYLGVGLHKYNPEIKSTNIIAFYYHYFESNYSEYDVLNMQTWQTNPEFIKLKDLVHSMQKLLVMGIRKAVGS